MSYSAVFWQLLRSLLELCFEAVRSCLEARFEAVQKFSFYIKNKIIFAAA